jgi:hypothetical protein
MKVIQYVLLICYYRLEGEGACISAGEATMVDRPVATLDPATAVHARPPPPPSLWPPAVLELLLELITLIEFPSSICHQL